MFDIKIENAKIYDGTGKESYISDIGIINDKIDKIGDLKNFESKQLICARNLSVMPGFIDTHTHTDMSLLYDRQHANGIKQGITTEIIGQDGLSYAPLSKDNLNMFAKYLRGLNGYFEDVKLDFSNVEQYLAKFHKKISVNVAYAVPHGTIRLEAMGFIDKPLTGYALEKAKDLMRESFEQGAVGFSTGLSYYPCSYADTKEMIELCKVCAEYDVPYITHTRTVFRDKVFDATLEAIDIAKEANCKLHYSHFRTGPDNAGRVDELLEPIERAINDGMKITLETYPYYSGSGYAVIFLPDWSVEGGYEATIKRLKDGKLRKKIIEGMKQNTIPTSGTFTHLVKNTEYIGMDFEDVAKLRNQEVHDVMCDLLGEENLEIGYYSNPTEDSDVREKLDKDFMHLLKRPYYMGCTDGIQIGAHIHPRTYASFIKFIRLAKEQNVSLEMIANRLSQNPAKTFNLNKRGTIAEGNYADIVIIDEEIIQDNATYQHPMKPSTGMEYVIVNGRIEVYQGNVTGVLNGYSSK